MGIKYPWMDGEREWFPLGVCGATSHNPKIVAQAPVLWQTGVPISLTYLNSTRGARRRTREDQTFVARIRESIGLTNTLLKGKRPRGVRSVAIALITLLVSLGHVQAAASKVTYVVFTTDVCWMCGSDFRGTYGGVDYGVPFIVDRLNGHGMRGTFFISPYCPQDQMSTFRQNMRFLVESGHDIQFHCHPDVCDVKRPNLTSYSMDERRELYKAGIEQIVRMGAPRPVAFRAGCYAIDIETLRMLPSIGISIDSSIFPNDPRSTVPLPLKDANRFTKIGGVYELPITLIRLAPLPGYLATTALDIDRTIWPEQRSALDQLASRNVPVVTVFMHYDNFYENLPPSKDFDPKQVCGDCGENISELDSMLRMLSRDKRFKVVTVRELWEIFQKDPKALEGPAFIPYTGMMLTYRRAVKHFYGHGVKNKIVALSPLAPILALGLIALLWGYSSRKSRGGSGRSPSNPQNPGAEDA